MDASTWYQAHEAKQGIMVQLFRHPQLDKNRLAPKIQQACQELWQRNDLMVSMDRVSFNPPETESYTFPGPNLHWDVSLKLPIPFGIQGLLYLSDTPENQGAFTLVPGFHHNIESWLKNLPESAHPREEDLHQFGAKPIGAEAGDFILWHHALPHGSSPNTGTNPRIVQYINYQPLDREIQKEWI
ncbi:MAG: phytanoyl-CoA dioxygenase family protein [Flavobacteriales bacterium]|nr:phytanoyl-CoA dioxygenase family protein [Flavobacteriales bacterium]